MMSAQGGCCVALKNLAFVQCAAFAMLLGGTCQTSASLKISSGETKDVSCTAGICSASAKKAVLNVNDLASMLASGDATVQSGSLAQDIEIDAALSWTGAHRLTLDSYHSIAFNSPVVVAGTGALTITTNHGGSGGDFRFFGKGHVEFWDLDSELIINGNTYVLENKVKRLARDVHHSGMRDYALAKSLNEKNHVYSNSPIETLSGTLEGLGNVVSNLKITSGPGKSPVGFIGMISSSGSRTVRDIGLVNASVTGGGAERCVGALVGFNFGIVANSYATGIVTAAGENAITGGLVCYNQFGNIVRSHSEVEVLGGAAAAVGGLAGVSDGEKFSPGLIESSYATGPVSGGDGTMVGGLVGYNWGGTISNSYSTSAITGGNNALLGGLVGSNADNPNEQSIPAVSTSYSTGAVSGGSGAMVGGLIGQDAADSQNMNNYWDLDTSGVSDPAQGAGNIANDPGITGLTTEQFKSGLPQGFDKKVWKEKAKLDTGYPYLLSNPPPKR
jgi:hypothetical protein